VAPSNKAMKLTTLSAAPFRGRSAASCPRRPEDAGTASQLIASVLRASRAVQRAAIAPSRKWPQSPAD
jgi:hypothetical protein